jgi:hypothetical protein
MKLEGIHHITAITGDARRNLDFYAARRCSYPSSTSTCASAWSAA